MSEGFHPKPRLSFPAPLGVGIEGTDEVMEFALADWVQPRKIQQALEKQLPEGLELVSLDFGSPMKAARATAATYLIQPVAALRADKRLSQERFDAVLARTEISVRRIRKRKEKIADIRPFILALNRRGEEVVLDVKAGPSGSTRPEEVLDQLGFDRCAIAAGFRIARTRVVVAP